jgi:ABC-2 type transport system ATP-binding protein
VIVDHGRLVAQSSLEALVAGTERVVHVRTPRAADLRELLLSDDGVRVQVVGPDRLEISGSTPERTGILAAAHRIPIFESTTQLANLEEAFFQLTEHDNDTAMVARSAAPALQEATR